LGVATLPIAFVEMRDKTAWLFMLGWALVLVAAVGPTPRPWDKPTLASYVDLPLDVPLPEAPAVHDQQS
jgi:hypothetical protein